ncbi:receptor-type tyrosine-protein phosphatase zeta-like isoform X2 [Macrobrachium nipponense]|uniref:receptor-type tyrosine-protein phosphatase zeta-like isoform X2 n=1 Tax=Macrobrachium nipponense TaxID=159736 RepID=UPI0030C7E1A3
MAEYSIAILRFIFLASGPVTYALGKNYNVLNNCQGSPVDFVPDLVKGRATISLPISLLDLQLSVEMKYVERDGIAVLQLSPVLRDERKCVDYPTGNRKLCYEKSEVHWGRTNEEGSDHSVGGYNYPMEVQHYFHRTNSTHSLIPVAVGVLFQEMSNDSLPHRPSDTSEGAFSEIHEKYPSFMEEKKRLTLGLARLLPSQIEEKPFYHYRGPVTGQCGPEIDWIVFEDPLEVVPSFLSFLGLLNGKDNLNHHFPPVSRNACYLYSHYSEETDRDDCGFNEAVARTVTSGNKPGNSPDSFQGKSVNASSDLATVETDKAGVLSSKFGGHATSQFDSVSTHSFDSRTVIAKIENVGIIPKETTPLLPQSAEFGGGITFEETPHPILPIASSTESAQPPRTEVKSTVNERHVLQMKLFIPLRRY